jgi:hypothetical protein
MKLMALPWTSIVRGRTSVVLSLVTLPAIKGKLPLKPADVSPPPSARPNSNTVAAVNDAPQGSQPQDSRPPRGALIVVAVGLIACVVAALAATGKGSGEAAYLEWVQNKEFQDSPTVETPGGGVMQLTETKIRATGTNVSGYSLFQVVSQLDVSKGTVIDGGHALCTTETKSQTEIAQSSGGLRALYPRSSEDGIWGQLVPETVLLDFSSHSSELASLEIFDLPPRFTTVQGVKLEWPHYVVGKERLDYALPQGKLKEDLELPFFSVWRSTAVPAAKISCRLETDAGRATVRTQVALKHQSPPIDEQAEEEKTLEKEEAEESSESEG